MFTNTDLSKSQGSTHQIPLLHVKLLAIVSLVFLAINCSGTVSSEYQLNSDDITVLEYGIYSLILDDVSSTSEYYVIEQETVKATIDAKHIESLRQTFTDFDITTVDNYTEVNDTSYTLEPLFSADKDVILLPTKKIEELFAGKGANEGWENFHNQYPGAGAFWRISRVGFNNNGDQGLVMTSHFFASLGGYGNLYYIVNEKGKWVVKKRLLLFIS